MTIPAQDIVERLATRAAECATASASDDKDRFMNVVAKFTRADGTLMMEAASELSAQNERIDFYAKCQVEAAEMIAAKHKAAVSLTADNEALWKDNARLSEEKDALAFGMRHGQSLSEDAIHAIRELLNEAGVPLAAFIDDHVGNAIVQRNQARAKGTALEAEVGRLREALKPFATYLDIAKFDLDNKGLPLPDDLGMGWVYLTVGDFRRARAALANEEARG